MSEPRTQDRLSAYASRSKAVVGGAFAMASFASADVVHHQLDTTFNLAQGEQGTLSLQGSGLFSPGSSDTHGPFSLTLGFEWTSSAIFVDQIATSFEPAFMFLNFRGAGISGGDFYTYGIGHVLGGSTFPDERIENGFITPPSETGLFFVGLQIRKKHALNWYGYIAIDLVSTTELRIDHWAIQTERDGYITTTLPSDGDPVPGLGGIAALALGASGVRRSRRRPI